MKKIIALLLVLVMLGSTTAFAAPVDTEILVGDEAAHFDLTIENGNATKGTQKTDLYLQVAASGQIDVTVPLVLVFKTNIDGGQAIAPNTYKLVNNSTAPLAVTDLVIVVDENNADSGHKMTLMGYPASGTSLNTDEYAVKFNAGAYSQDIYQLVDKVVDTNTGVATYTDGAIANAGGLFGLPLDNGDDTDNIKENEVHVKLDMVTGKLSFVTKHEDNGELDSDKGLKLLTLTYTVAIDTKAAIAGDDIKDDSITGHTIGDDGKVTTYTYNYTGTDTSNTSSTN